MLKKKAAKRKAKKKAHSRVKPKEKVNTRK
jgi:hypothetical protein